MSVWVEGNMQDCVHFECIGSPSGFSKSTCAHQAYKTKELGSYAIRPQAC